MRHRPATRMPWPSTPITSRASDIWWVLDSSIDYGMIIQRSLSFFFLSSIYLSNYCDFFPCLSNSFLSFFLSLFLLSPFSWHIGPLFLHDTQGSWSFLFKKSVFRNTKPYSLRPSYTTSRIFLHCNPDHFFPFFHLFHLPSYYHLLPSPFSPSISSNIYPLPFLSLLPFLVY